MPDYKKGLGLGFNKYKLAIICYGIFFISVCICFFFLSCALNTSISKILGNFVISFVEIGYFLTHNYSAPSSPTASFRLCFACYCVLSSFF